MPIDLDHQTERIDTASEVLWIDDTGAIRVPVGTTAERPASPADGMLRLNSTTGNLEYFSGGAWRDLQSSASLDRTRIEDADSSTWVDTDELGETITFGTNGALRMWLVSTGELGVGTASPAAAVHALRGGQPALIAERSDAPDAAVVKAPSSTSARLHLADAGTSSDSTVGIASSGDSLVLRSGGADRVELDPTGKMVIGGTSPAVGLEVRTTDAFLMPVGSTAQRPAGSNGMIRYNSDDDKVEAYVAGTWTFLTTKDYVDAVAQGLSWKEAVRVKDVDSTDTASYTYNPAADGAPNALVWTNVIAPVTWDGITLNDGDRILITEASDKRGNGIFVYDATAQGFRRAPDADNQPGAEIQGGSAVFVQEGTSFGDTGWVISDPPGAITLGTDQISWIQFTAAASLTASNGIVRIGNDFQLTGQALALHQFSGVGYMVRTGPGTFVARAIDGTPQQIQILNNDGTAGNTVISIANDPLIPGTSRIGIPAGTTADRPGTPAAGDLRFNTDNNQLEFYDGTSWFRMGTNGDFVLRAGDTMLGELGIVAGTVSAPGLYVVGDTNTGIYQPAADNFAIAAAGFGYLVVDGSADSIAVHTTGRTNAIYVDSVGRVGFGGIPTTSVDAGSHSGAFGTPKGSTAQRPAGVAGYFRFNTDTGRFEGYDGTQWVDFQSSATSATRYVVTFNSTTDWSGPVGGYYSISIPESAHGRGTDPVIQVFEGATAPYTHVQPDGIEVAANGDVTIYVSETPDGRFAGKAVLI